jgi:hypothetical protein
MVLMNKMNGENAKKATKKKNAKIVVGKKG